MPYSSREQHNAWQRAYRARKREGLTVRVVEIVREERRREREAYARAAERAYRERQGVGA